MIGFLSPILREWMRERNNILYRYSVKTTQKTFLKGGKTLLVEGSAKLFIPHTSTTYEGMFQLHVWYKKKPLFTQSEFIGVHK